MSASNPLRAIVEALEASRIPHMVAGSTASTLHGIPRTTNDVDLVIDPTRDALDDLVRRLPRDRWYVSDTAAHEAWHRRGQFNVIDLASGMKVDLILRKQRPFSVEEFARRERAEILGTAVFVATAEDTILAKLEWAGAGESERQLRDVAGVLSMRGASLDAAYLERWAAELGVEDLLQRARALAAR